MTFILHESGRRFTGPEFVVEVRNRAACPRCLAKARASCRHSDGSPRAGNHEERVFAVTGQTGEEKAKVYGNRYGKRFRRRSPLKRGWV